MARPSQRNERRAELVPVLARTFADLGYRRTTTAELAARCEVRENVLYRLWPDKRAMFTAAIDFVYELSEATWGELLEASDAAADPAELLLEYEAGHQGEFGLYRIVFAGLSETDDPAVAEALRGVYRRFHDFVRRQIGSTESPEANEETAASGANAADLAWALIGLGTVSNIGRELGLLTGPGRRQLFAGVGRVILSAR